MATAKTISGMSNGEDVYAYTQADIEIVLACVGSYGLNEIETNANVQAVANRVAAWTPDAVFTTGDNCFGLDFADDVTPFYGSFVTRGNFWPCPGYDDVGKGIAEPANTETYLDFFTALGRANYYKRRIGPVALYMLASPDLGNGDHLATGLQYAWLARELAGSRAAWNVVVLNQSPYTSASGSAYQAVTTLRWGFGSLGADLVLSGRARLYERLLVATDDNTPYVVNGCGGAVLTSFGTTVAESVVRDATHFGAGKLAATPTRLRWTFHNTDDTILDTLELTKG